MRIAIIGSGNVGMAFGTALANNGHEILFQDVVPKTPIIGRFTLLPIVSSLRGRSSPSGFF